MSAGLVSQHQQSSFASPVNGAAGDATVVLGNDNATVSTYNSHDADATIHLQSSTAAVFATVPAGTLGRKWMTNDSGAVYLYYDTGSVWVEVNYLRTASTGAVTITSTTAPQLTVAYDGLNYLQLSITSAGAVTLNATGASAGFTFSDAVILSSTLVVASNVTVNGATLAANAIAATSMVLSSNLTVNGATTAVQALTVATTARVTGVATFTAQPILSSLTASQAVFTDGSKGLVSNAITGTGNVVMSASPTLTGTITAAAVTASGLITASAGLTVASGQTLTLNGATLSGTIAGTPTFSGLFTVTAGITVASSSGVLNVGGMSPNNANPHYVALANANAAVGTPSGGGFLYVESGALKFIGTSGTITTVAPA